MEFMPLYSDLFDFMRETKLAPWVDDLIPLLKEKLQDNPHGDLARWLNALNSAPELQPSSANLDVSRVGTSGNISEQERLQLEQALKGLSPWRKGPYELYNIHIDTEWRSDWKWERIKNHISPLHGRTILDVGCGSGYHCWRMLGDGASRVIGIDPSFLFLMQFEIVKKYCGKDLPIHLLPVRMEDVRPQLEAFDTTFSMGVLYHRRSPIDHLLELKGTLRRGGELVLETLVTEGELGYSLMPEDRYAQMRNVWYLPSVPTLELWLKRAGFENIKCVEQNQTTLEEQRSTEWMQYQSLKDFLDPENQNLTIEGYPSPLRATFVATKK